MQLYVHLWISAFVQYTQQFMSVKVQHSACSSVPNCFYGCVGAAKNGVWLTDSFFLIFGRGHIQIAYTPPVPPPPPPCSSVAPAHSTALAVPRTARRGAVYRAMPESRLSSSIRRLLVPAPTGAHSPRRALHRGDTTQHGDA